MKFQLFIAAAVVLAMSACKTPYKATDRPTTTTDSTASATDTTSSSMNKMPVSTDSTNVSRMDSTNKSLPDSAKVSSAPDSVQAKPVTDSAKVTPDTTQMRSTADTANKMQPATDSANKMQTATDSAKATTTIDSTAKSTEAPAAVEAVFTKQYPGATNVVWSSYDSLAAIPIDMRLTGWKKMDAEDYMVTFDFKDQNYYAWYDNNGKWVGSAHAMEDFTKLPAAVNTAVKNAIKTRYSEYNITKVNREFKTGNKSAYEVELTKDDNKVKMLVNADGKITQIFKYAADKKE